MRKMMSLHKWILLISLCTLSFVIGWRARMLYETNQVVEETPAAQEQEIVYPELPEGAINDLRGK